jgi:hypothetical protein
VPPTQAGESFITAVGWIVTALALRTSGGIFERDHLGVSSQTKIPGYWAKIASCSFCGHRAEKGQKFVEGPGVYICDACVALGVEAISIELKRNPEPKKAPEAKKAPVELFALCSFCGKKWDEVRALIDGPGLTGLYICDTCVAVSVKIIAGEWERAPGPNFTTSAHLYRPKGWRKTPLSQDGASSKR